MQSLWKTVWRFLKKLRIKPMYGPAIPLLGTYPEETKIERDTCIPLFTAVLFTIARTWNTLDAHHQMEKEVVVHIHNGILLSHQKGTHLSVLMRWRNLEPFIQSEVSQKEKDKYCILTHIYGI